MPADQRLKTEIFSSIMCMLAYWAMCGGGTVTCDPPEPDVPKDNPKTLVDEMKDKMKDKGGVKSLRRCNGGYPRDDDDPQTIVPVEQCRVFTKKSCVKLNRVNVEQKMGGSNCSSSSSSSSDGDVGSGYADQTGLTSTSESDEDDNTGGFDTDLDKDQDVTGSSSDDDHEEW